MLSQQKFGEMNAPEDTDKSIIITDRYVNFEIFKKVKELNPYDEAYMKVYTYLNEGILPKCIGMGLGGGFLGIFIGAFLFTMQPNTIDYTLNYKQQLKEHYTLFKQSIKNSSINFAKVGFLYSFYENSLQKIRASNDLTNTLYSGCLTGATISYKAGGLSMLGGCASFAAFSVLVEKLQRSSKF